MKDEPECTNDIQDLDLDEEVELYFDNPSTGVRTYAYSIREYRDIVDAWVGVS